MQRQEELARYGGAEAITQSQAGVDGLGQDMLYMLYILYILYI